MATLSRGLFSQASWARTTLTNHFNRIGISSRIHPKTAKAIRTTNGFKRGMSSYPPHEVVGMPSLSPTMESGQIARWNKSAGEEFQPGDILCEVQTDKATVDFEAQDEGFVAKILAEAGPTEINCGEPILITVDDEDNVAAFKDYILDAQSSDGAAAAAAESPKPEAAAPPAAAAPAPAPAAVVSPPSLSSGKVMASPLAFKLAKEMGHDIAAVVGTGPGGRIIADDVREFVPVQGVAAAASEPVLGAPVPAAPAMAAQPIIGTGFTDYPFGAGAQEAAARLTHSKQNVPHYYLMADIHLDAALDLRASLNKTLAGTGEDDEDEGITLNDLLLKAAACSMKAVPSANASWMDTFVRVYDSVDINVYVGSGDGLYAPLIRNVDTSGIRAISTSVAAAAKQASERSLTVEACAPGTFSFVNLGMYGIKSCAPIIMEPQACILALGCAENRIIPNEDHNSDDEDLYQQAVMLTATLSCDHRVVDGAVGAQWLSAFKSHVENPSTLLL